MSTRPGSRLASERGATLVHVAIALMSLMGLAAYSVDRGVVWVSRGQAQNAADAGALAAATARGFDEFTDPPAGGGPAEMAALAAAGANDVWGVPGSAEVWWRCPMNLPPGVVALSGGRPRCARVNVYRNQDHNNALPAILAPVLGITEQGVRAMATAVVSYGNAARCVRPFAIPDWWSDSRIPADEYNHWSAPGVEFPQADSYGAPGALWDADESDGFSDIGRAVTFEPANGSTIQTDRFFTIDRAGGPPSDAINSCIGPPVAIGQSPLIDLAGMPDTSGPVAALINLDQNAVFDANTKRIVGSCVPGCGPISPRIVPIVVFDPEHLQFNQIHGWPDCPRGPCLRVVNILGLFVTGSGSGTGVTGHLMLLPGRLVAGFSSPPAGSNFLVRAQLVR